MEGHSNVIFLFLLQRSQGINGVLTTHGRTLVGIVTAVVGTIADVTQRNA